MRIPKSVRVAASEFQVILESDVHHRGNRGECSHEGLKIRLSTSMPLTRQHRTLVHEIIESINEEYDVGLKHHQINLLEAGLYAFITDNPEVFNATQEGQRPEGD